MPILLRLFLLILTASALAVLFVACSSDGGDSAVPAAVQTDSGEAAGAEDGDDQSSPALEKAATITFTSPVFNEKRRIPKKHTCTEERTPPDGAAVAGGQSTAAGENISPSLDWTDLPEGTASFALIVDSNEAAAPWTHWVVWNIPADSTGLAEGVSNAGEIPDGTRQGVNSGGEVGYLGPCPPPFLLTNRGTGDTVRNKDRSVEKYHFWLYALDTVLDLAPDATKGDLLGAMEGHVLGVGELTGERVGKKILKDQ